MDAQLIFLIAVVAIIVYFIIIYNKFVSLNARIDASWSDIDVQLKRRYNLIPALVETVKSYSNYEKETLENVIKARQAGIDAGTPKDQGVAENLLTGALGKIFALAEAYPDLKANESYAKLQNELANIEEAIQNARNYYNAVVRDFNAMTKSFPDLFVAQKFNFQEREYFEIDDPSHKEMPKLNL